MNTQHFKPSNAINIYPIVNHNKTLRQFYVLYIMSVSPVEPSLIDWSMLTVERHLFHVYITCIGLDQIRLFTAGRFCDKRQHGWRAREFGLPLENEEK